jgi:Helix-turn-helix.
MSNEQNIGTLIRKYRKIRKLTQKELSHGLCSQAMLSAIENGKHIPNSELFISLLQRMQISFSDISLHNHYELKANIQRNKKIQQLCDKHEYRELYQLLIAQETIDSLEEESDYRIYYYYLGCATFHVEDDLHQSEELFHLALAEVSSVAVGDSLNRLIYASLGLIAALKNNQTVAKQYFIRSLENVEYESFQENIAVVFYLKALSEMKLKVDRNEIERTLQTGIKYITANKSIYILANFYYLLSQLYNAGSDEEAIAINRTRVFQELYGERVYTKKLVY